jgi:hypothetical protein
MTTATDNFSSWSSGNALDGVWTQVRTTASDINDWSTGSSPGANILKRASGVNAASAYTGGVVFRNDISPGNNQYSEVTVGDNYNFCHAALVRGSGSDTTLGGYVGYYNPFDGRLQLIRAVSNAWTSLGTYTLASISNSDTIRVEANGSTIKLFHNDVERISASDANIASGSVGFGVRSQDAPTYSAISAWEGGDLAGGSIVPQAIAQYINQVIQ